MEPTAVDWGDVPSWVTAAGSVLALIFAAAAVLAAARTFRIEVARHELYNQARQEQELLQRRSQAVLVSAWVVHDCTGDELRRAVHVRNASEIPVYEVHLTVIGHGNSRTATKLDLGVVPPTREARSYQLPHLDTAGAGPWQFPEGQGSRVRITFTDAAGVRWMRDEYGRLTEVNPNLVVWVHDRIASVLGKLGAEFQRAYGVTMSFETKVFRDLQDRFIAMHADSSTPSARQVDVLFGPHDWTGNLVETGSVESIVISEHDHDYFWLEAIEALSLHGKLYAIPAIVDTVVLYRNVDLVPEAPSTFDELLDIGFTLKKVGRVIEPLALQVSNVGDPFHMHPLFTSAGGSLFGEAENGAWDLETVNVATPESIAAFEYIQSLGETGVGVLRREIGESAATELFLCGKTPFLVTTSWGAAHAAQEGLRFDASPVPAVSGGRPPECLVVVNGFFVATRSENQDLAVDLIADFLTRSDVSEGLARDLLGVVPAEAHAPRDPVLATLTTQCARGKLMPSVPRMREVWSLLGVAEAEIIGGADVPATARQLAYDLQSLQLSELSLEQG